MQGHIQFIHQISPQHPYRLGVPLINLIQIHCFKKEHHYYSISQNQIKSLLFLMQITVHNKLSLIMDKQATKTEAFDTLQLNFQGLMRFWQVNLLESLVDTKTAPAPTDIAALQLLFNKIFELFSKKSDARTDHERSRHKGAEPTGGTRRTVPFNIAER
ncbi:uncharacterized protein VP01_3113g1 [Puccinia sorghi]|uniref:Uncharacterized protein n=1 Tax=Puccinia sorghi TaxID=27349 RepID=A0A0L6V168_9BASI|nr:uncharacterized protein VP01_3113g1 [Puccinia sorghi]